MARLADLLKRVLAPRREMRLAYLFGSVGKGRRHGAQDLDLAVVLRRPLEGMEKFRYRVRLARIVGKALGRHPIYGGKSVDIVVLNDADPLLAHQVVKYGRLLFERGKHADRDFRVHTMTRYFDAKPLHDFFFQQAMRRA